MVQISKDDKTKSVGIVKVNLADFIEDKVTKFTENAKIKIWSE